MKIQKRLNSLQIYNFSNDKYFIRPAVSTKEIIGEGKALKICVGNYSNGYITGHATGRTNILVLRKVSEPNKPFFTMEVKSDNIKQTYGYDHCIPKSDVKEFVDAFKAHITQNLSKRKSKKLA
jgi:hypothetical protein